MISNQTYEIEPIAHIRTPYPEKFGIPRQSGLVQEAPGTIEFVSKYHDPDALRGIEDFSHIWLIWGFSQVEQDGFVPVVRPPRLGGNEKVGVFASRSPYRPNRLGLSVVKLDGVETSANNGCILHVSGADLLDGTPIYDIKPYLPYADSIPDANGGFAHNRNEGMLNVCCDEELIKLLGDDAVAIFEVLARDPRPAYHDDPKRIYNLRYASWNIRFSASDDTLTVLSIE